MEEEEEEAENDGLRLVSMDEHAAVIGVAAVLTSSIAVSVSAIGEPQLISSRFTLGHALPTRPSCCTALSQSR